MVDFGAPKPYPAYPREHSPDYGTHRGRSGEAENALVEHLKRLMNREATRLERMTSRLFQYRGSISIRISGRRIVATIH